VLSIDVWAQDALTRLRDRPGVRRVGLALVEGGGRRLRVTASDREHEAQVDWCHVDAYDDVPLNVALRRGTVVLGDLDELSEGFAEFVGRQRDTPTIALAAIPVVAAGRPVGGFLLYFDRAQTFDDEHRHDLEALGRQLGAGLRHAQRGEVRRPVIPSEGAVSPGTLVADHRVDPDPAAVGAARRFVRRILQDWDVDEYDAGTAVLCLSELVTNAVIHSHAGCAVRVRLEDDVLTVTVRDSGRSDAGTLARPDDPLQVHGRGLRVVEALTARWRYDLDAVGTTVWFVLDL